MAGVPGLGTITVTSQGEVYDANSSPSGTRASSDVVQFFADPSHRRLDTGTMMSFFEFLAQSRKMALPDTHTLLAMAGVGLDVPNEEETKRLLNWEKKRQPTGGRKAQRTINRLDGKHTPSGEGRP